VVDLDDEIVEMVLARQPVAALLAPEPDWPIVMAITRVFAPGILRPDGVSGDKAAWPRMTIGPPPQFSRMKDAPRRAAIALALVGKDAAAPERDRDGHAISR